MYIRFFILTVATGVIFFLALYMLFIQLVLLHWMFPALHDLLLLRAVVVSHRLHSQSVFVIVNVIDS